MPPGYDDNALFLNHIWVKDEKVEYFIVSKDGQNEVILLPEQQLKFALLFYSLALLEQAESTDKAFLKIPRKEHLLDEIPVGHTNREKNVKAFKEACRHYSEKYSKYLSTEQKDWLSLQTEIHLIDFSTFFSVDKEGVPWLHIHYSRGKGMLPEEKRGSSEEEAMAKAIKDFNMACFEINEANRKMSDVENELANMPSVSTKDNFLTFGGARRKQNSAIAKQKEKTRELQVSLGKAEQKKQDALNQLKALEKKIIRGGVHPDAKGVDGVGRSEQRIAVKLPERVEDIATFKFTIPDHLLIKDSPFEPNIPAPQQTHSTVGKMLLHLRGINFRKTGRNSDYPDFKTKATKKERVTVDNRLERMKKSFKEEVDISNESEWPSEYDLNRTTNKPVAYSRFCMGKTLEQLKNDISFSLKQRLILCYLVLKAYEKFSHNGKNYFYHCDLKEANIMVQRIDNKIEITLVDRAFTLKSESKDPVFLTEMQPQMGGAKPVALQRGTGGYMAPETDHGCYSELSDIFALGFMFEELLFKEKKISSSLTDQQDATFGSLHVFCQNSMRAAYEERVDLQESLKHFEQALRDFDITDFENLEHQGQLFENHLPDKAKATYRMKI